MEKLLKSAREVSEQAEVFSIKTLQTRLVIEDSKLKDTLVSLQRGTALRIIRDGKLGFAYTRSLVDPKALIDSALSSLKAGVAAPNGFSQSGKIEDTSRFDSNVAQIEARALIDESEKLMNRLDDLGGQLNLNFTSKVEELEILNTLGTSLCHKSTQVLIDPMVLYPNSYAFVGRKFISNSFQRYPDEAVAFTRSLYPYGKDWAPVPSLRPEKMKVFFLPEALFVFAWRLQNGMSAKSLYEKQTPLSMKLNQQIASEVISLSDDPLDDANAQGRRFDDEGTECHSNMLIDRGVFKRFYSDLNYGEKTATPPTANGWRRQPLGFEADTISIKPTPSAPFLKIAPGATPYDTLVKSMDRGIIVSGPMGAHSGNIPNGDFSIGLAPGFYVEGEKILGRIKEGIVTGNIYDLLEHVVDIEDQCHWTTGGTFPAILFDNVSVNFGS